MDTCKSLLGNIKLGSQSSVSFCKIWRKFQIDTDPATRNHADTGENIDNYTFFEYGLSEALHTSNDEKEILIEIIGKIEKEINNNLDRHSHKLIVTNLEL